MKLFHGSIRKKLIILVLLATTPVFLVLLGTELVNRQHAVNEAQRETAQFLNGFAEVQRRITGSTRTLLRTLASIPEIRDANVERSRVILTTLLETNPIYTNVILVDLEGNVVAAGRNHDRARGLNFADRKQFKEAILLKGFASGEYVVGKSSKKAIFPFGMAVLDKEGAPKGAIIIGVRLSHYGEVFKRGAYRPNTFFGICDHRGRRLFRYPHSEKAVIGKPIKSKVFQVVEAAGEPGSVLALASDGLKRVIAFEPLRLVDGKSPYMYMFIGFDHGQIQERAHAILARVAITSCLSLTLALAIAWGIGGSGIARRIEKLALMTRKFTEGDQNVISEMDYSDGEMGDLAKSFDNMVLMLRQWEDERNEALDQLSASERRFREVIEDVSEISILGYDEQRNITFWNYSSEKLYGYTKEEALGKKLEDLIIPPGMKDDVKRLHARWIEVGYKIPAGEVVLTDKQGSDVPVFSSHAMHETQSGKEMFSFDIDMTAIKQSEIEKKHLLDQLRQSQKMEAIGTLAGGIAHDFNNILFPIMGYAEILMDEAKESDSAGQNSLKQIYSSALRAKELVQQILTFSRQESTEYKPIKVQHILKEVVKLLRSTIPSNIEIVESVDRRCRAISADATQIHQIIMNFATNAYHAMDPDGGELKIHLSERTIDLEASKELGIKAGPVVCLAVSDTGTGIAPDLIEQIFDPFFTTKEKGKGTGMGLSVVHGIVKNMNGGIDVHSELRRGTEFRVFFPVMEERFFNSRDGDRAEAAILPGTERILLVDDEDVILRMECLALERLGYKVKSKSNPVEALAVFRSSPDAFDLVMTDLSMPRMSGDELTSEILGIRSDIPIILCTGFSEKMTPEIARDMGIKAVVTKPVLLKDLSVKIRDLLDDTIEADQNGEGL